MLAQFEFLSNQLILASLQQLANFIVAIKTSLKFKCVRCRTRSVGTTTWREQISSSPSQDLSPAADHSRLLLILNRPEKHSNKYHPRRHAFPRSRHKLRAENDHKTDSTEHITLGVMLLTRKTELATMDDQSWDESGWTLFSFSNPLFLHPYLCSLIVTPSI